VIVAAFVIAAFLTPPDPFSQLVMAILLLAVYEISVLFSRLGERRKQLAVA